MDLELAYTISGCILVVVLPVLVLQFLVASLRAGRRGASETTPVCVACGYSARGWSEARCPECGHDASERGVQVGALGGDRIARQVAIVSVIFGLGPLVAALVDDVTAHTMVKRSVRHHAINDERLAAYTGAAEDAAWFPPSRTWRAVLCVEWRVDGATARRAINFDDDGGAPSEAVLRALLADLSDGAADPAYAVGLHELANAMPNAGRTSRAGAADAQWRIEVESVRNIRLHRTRRPILTMILVTLVVTVLCLVAERAVKGWVPDGVRGWEDGCDRTSGEGGAIR